MSNWTGKGSKSRVQNLKAFNNCPLWDNIGKNMNKTKRKCLFLDDAREVSHAFLWEEKQSLTNVSGIREWEWDIVRSYDEFVTYLEHHGIPDVVSFDNDLCQNDAVNTELLIKQFQMEDWQEFTIKTGAHCAQYLVDMCVRTGADIPKYYIHTANSSAVPIIKAIMNNTNANV